MGYGPFAAFEKLTHRRGWLQVGLLVRLISRPRSTLVSAGVTSIRPFNAFTVKISTLLLHLSLSSGRFSEFDWDILCFPNDSLIPFLHCFLSPPVARVASWTSKLADNLLDDSFIKWPSHLSCSWAWRYRGRHYDSHFYIYTLFMHTNTRSLEAV